MTPEERAIHAAKMRLANLPRRERETWKLPKKQRDQIRRRLYDQAQADYELIRKEKNVPADTTQTPVSMPMWVPPAS